MATMPSSRLQSRRSWIAAAAARKSQRSAAYGHRVAANAAPAQHPKTSPATDTPFGEAPRRTRNDDAARAHAVDRDASGRRSAGPASSEGVVMGGRGYRPPATAIYLLRVDDGPENRPGSRSGPKSQPNTNQNS